MSTPQEQTKWGTGVVGQLIPGAAGLSFNAEEQRNIDTVLAFIKAPKPLSGTDKERLRTPTHRANHVGFVNLIEMTGFSGPGGFTAGSVSDRRDEIQDVIAKGDRVWVLAKLRGTHTAPVFGVPASGKPIEPLELLVFRLEDGRIAESWFMMEELAFLAQIGANLDIPDGPAQTAEPSGR